MQTLSDQHRILRKQITKNSNSTQAEGQWCLLINFKALEISETSLPINGAALEAIKYRLDFIKDGN